MASGRPQPGSSSLPLGVAISAITLAELTAGPHATDDPKKRSRRQDRLQPSEAAFNPLPFGADAARGPGRVFSAVMNGSTCGAASGGIRRVSDSLRRRARRYGARRRAHQSRADHFSLPTGYCDW